MNEAKIDTAALVYQLCKRLWKCAYSNVKQPELFDEMSAPPVVGDLVFVDLVLREDPDACFGVLLEIEGPDAYVLRLADGTTQRWGNVGLHKMPIDVHPQETP